MSSRRLLTPLLPLVVLSLAMGPALSATWREQRQLLGEANAHLRAADRLIRAGRHSDAADQFNQAQARVQQAAAEGVDPRAEKLVRRAAEQLQQLHVALADKADGLAGLELPELRIDSMDTKEDSRRGESPPAGVSFARQVAPLLAAKCGPCHIDAERGGLSLATYAALMRGSAEGGRVLVAGEAEGSVLVDMIASGDMPRGGGRVTTEELAMLVRWINEGARNDGPTSTTPLGELVAGGRPVPTSAQPAEPAMARVARATGDETVRFALEIAPLLTEACLDCHGGQQTRANLSIATFAGLLRGGDSGPTIVPGQPDASLLIQRLRGEGGDRMPLNRDPLPPAVIEKIVTWIREGSRFDGSDSHAPLARVAQLARADAADATRLSQIREASAEKNWRLANPDDAPMRVRTTGLLVLGNLPEPRLEQLATQADAQFDQIKRLFRHPEDEPPVKGRVTLFLFGRRLDYSEFGTMVEGRELPAVWRGNWGYDGVDAYAAVLPASGSEFSNEALLAQQLAGVYVASRSRGKLPRWLTEGAARVAAARLAPRDPRVEQWNDEVASAFGQLVEPGDFMQGKLPLEAESVLAYSFVSGLMKRPASFQELLGGVAAGRPLDDAFRASYRATPAELAVAWARSVARR